MTGIALGLILFSAFVHASWNYLLKKSGGGTGLITAASVASLVLYPPIVAIALLSPLSYILVLTAMVFTPVSLVAPAREMSILFAALGMVLGIGGLALG